MLISLGTDPNSCIGIMSSSDVLIDDLINSTCPEHLRFRPAFAAFLQNAVKLLRLFACS